MEGFQQTLQTRGLALETARRGAAALLARTLETQTLFRYCLKYFGLASLGLLALPPLHRQAVSFRARPL